MQVDSLKAWIVGKEERLRHGRPSVAAGAHEPSHHAIGPAAYKGHNAVACSLRGLHKGGKDDHDANSATQGVVHIAQHDGQRTAKELRVRGREEGTLLLCQRDRHTMPAGGGHTHNAFSKSCLCAQTPTPMLKD